MINKKKIKILAVFLFVLAVLIFMFFRIVEKDKEKEFSVLDHENTEFNIPPTAYLNSFKVAIFLNEKEESIFNAEEITKNSKKKFDSDLRKKIIELLNMPLSKIPASKATFKELVVELIKETDYEKYKEEKIFFMTSNISGATGYLLTPKNVDFPAPGIIAMHQHGGGERFGADEIVGKIGDPTLAYAKELAERGYVVLAVDTDGFGSRKLKLNDSAAVLEKIDTQSLFLRGLSPLGVVVQEDLVSLELLLSLEIVDKDNIGCIGHSFGGIRCMYLAALDKRVKATVLSSSVADIRKDTESGITSTWLTILPGIGKYAGTSEVLALIAPRPLLTLTGEYDPIFPAFEAKEHAKETEDLYKKLNEKDNFVPLLMINKSHDFPMKFHEMTYQFLDKHLKNN